MSPLARHSREQQAHNRCVLGTELELLRAALTHWRFKLTDRVAGSVESNEALAMHRSLVARHRVVIAAAATGTEVMGSK